MTKEKIKQVAKQTSIENLKKILIELELNPEEFKFYDVKIMHIIYKKELELKLKQLSKKQY
ncbi:MAG TPA: hypothetical protein DCS17_01745 [Flavobacterium sp.]|nr:hypothetical protein [Flavobacterium sp.]